MRVALTVSYQFVGALTDVKFRQSLKNASFGSRHGWQSSMWRRRTKRNLHLAGLSFWRLWQRRRAAEIRM